MSCDIVDIENVENTLVSINAAVDSLQSNTSSINGSLQSIAIALDDAFSNCTALMMVDCTALDPSTYSNGLGANYFEVSISPFTCVTITRTPSGT